MDGTNVKGATSKLGNMSMWSNSSHSNLKALKQCTCGHFVTELGAAPIDRYHYNGIKLNCHEYVK